MGLLCVDVNIIIMCTSIRYVYHERLCICKVIFCRVCPHRHKYILNGDVGGAAGLANTIPLLSLRLSAACTHIRKTCMHSHGRHFSAFLVW